jgi:hypothetical protein
MSFFFELLGEFIVPVLEIFFWISGRSPDWATTRDDRKERSSVFSILVWLTAFVLLCAGLAWLALR